MKTAIKLPVGLALIALSIVACEQMPGTGAPSVVVVDLEMIAKTTGLDTEIEQQMTNARNEANAKLNEVAVDLESQLNQEREKLGDEASEADQQALRQLTAQAQQQFAQAQNQAQQNVQQYQASLVVEFQEKVQPIAAEIAAKRGATLALIAGPTLFWYDPSADITAEVLAEMQARQPADDTPTLPDTGTTALPETSDATPEADTAPVTDPQPEAGAQSGGEPE
jgi:Skp family chaperone for outer membrane proteins